jgi:hypothetical protein
MPQTSAPALSALLILSIAAMPLAARAQAVSAACKPVIDANTKEISTPHHGYQTQEKPGAEGKTTMSEIIATATASYVLVDGKWTRINVTPKDNLAQMQENLKNAKVYNCQTQPDATINGVPMLVYLAHSENDMAKTDARFWVAKSTGLIYREDIDMYGDEGDGKQHMSIRYDYTNVQPPAGVK